MNLSRAVTTAPGGPPVRRSRAKRRLIGLAAVALVLIGCWVLRAPLLRGVASLWIVSDPITVSDASLVLGGGLDTRPFGAANLYTNHLVKLVLVPKSKITPSELLGVTRSHFELNREALLRLGVPGDSIQLVGEDVANTYDEALAARAWAQKNGAKQIIVATDLFHTRRVRWIFTKVFADTEIRVLVQPLDHYQYTQRDWWRHESGLIAFQNEVIKHLYYRWKY